MSSLKYDRNLAGVTAQVNCYGDALHVLSYMTAVRLHVLSFIVHILPLWSYMKHPPLPYLHLLRYVHGTDRF